jgi:hypothetical protein
VNKLGFRYGLPKALKMESMRDSQKGKTKAAMMV